MKKTFVSGVVVVCVAAMASAIAADDSFKCKARNDLVGSCWKVHGRLRVGNGNPATRIWPIGTKRLLGVQDEDFGNDEESAEPAEIRKYGFTAQIFADFIVCPLTKEKPGEMQIVCISGAKNIHVEKWLDRNLNEIKPVWFTVPDVSEKK